MRSQARSGYYDDDDEFTACICVLTLELSGMMMMMMRTTTTMRRLCVCASFLRLDFAAVLYHDLLGCLATLRAQRLQLELK